jgi:ABC-type nitrate/sulfonate/bicarbonate transport system substrate-binding protein
MSSQTIRKLLYSVLLCLISTTTSTAAFADEPRIAVSRSPLSLPFFVAKEKNLFPKYGVAPVITECLGGNRCVKELVDGKVDMATSTELPFMFAAYQGKPISLVATFVTNKDDMKFVVRKSAIPAGIKSIVGKRVGYVERASSHYYMDLFLLYQGIDPNSIIPVPMGAEALASALAKGEVDAISAWEPWGQVALELGGADVEVMAAPRLYSQTFNLLISNQHKQTQPRQISAVLNALSEAIQFIKKNPEESKLILARHAGIDAKTVNVVWPIYRFELSLQQSLLTTLQGQARWAKRESHVDASLAEPEFLNFIDPVMLRKINPGAVDFAYP